MIKCGNGEKKGTDKEPCYQLQGAVCIPKPSSSSEDPDVKEDCRGKEILEEWISQTSS